MNPPFVETRGDPPTEGVVVVRGGEHSLDHEKVKATAEDAMIRVGHFAVSTFGTVDGDVWALCLRVPRLHGPGPGKIWVARVGDLWASGFEVLDTPPDDHYDVILPDLEPETTARLRACFTLRVNPTRSPPVR